MKRLIIAAVLGASFLGAGFAQAAKGDKVSLKAAKRYNCTATINGEQQTSVKIKAFDGQSAVVLASNRIPYYTDSEAETVRRYLTPADPKGVSLPVEDIVCEEL